MKRCQAKTKSGDQCRNNAILGMNFCYLTSHGAGSVRLYKRALNLLFNKWSIFLITILLGVTPIVINHYENKLHSSSGVLSSESKAIQNNIAIGGIRIVLETSNNVVIRDNGEPVLSIQIIKNKLYVSAIIRGDDGDLIAEISKNEWKLNENQRFDRNYNDNALEVKDGSGKIVMQVVNFGDVIHFAGIFHTKKGRVVSFIPLEDSTAAIEIRPSDKDLQLHIDPIFEYPSDLHFGSCPGIEKLEKILRAGTTTFNFGNAIDIGKRSKGQGIIKLV